MLDLAQRELLFSDLVELCTRGALSIIVQVAVSQDTQVRQDLTSCYVVSLFGDVDLT